MEAVADGPYEELEQGIDKRFGVKVLQILDGFSHSDQPNRNFKGVRDSYDDAAARRSIKLGQGDSGHADRFVELSRLGDGILADRRIQHQQHFMGRALTLLRDDAFNLSQLFHQIGFGMQPPGRINEHHV